MDKIVVKFISFMFNLYLGFNMIIMSPFIMVDYVNRIKPYKYISEIERKVYAIESIFKWLWFPKKFRDDYKSDVYVNYIFNINKEA